MQKNFKEFSYLIKNQEEHQTITYLVAHMLIRCELLRSNANIGTQYRWHRRRRKRIAHQSRTHNSRMRLMTSRIQDGLTAT